MSPQTKVYYVNGINLNVQIQGDGEPLLLLHGYPDSMALWRKTIPTLVAKGYQVIVPDMRGFGGSDAPEGVKNYTIDLVVSDYLALLEQLKLNKVHLIAHDWGAIIGWYLACKHPNRFYSYTALSVGHPKSYASAGWEQKRKAWYTLFFQLRGFAEWLILRHDGQWIRNFVDHHPETEHWINDLSRPGRITSTINLYRANLWQVYTGKLPDCTIPVMGVWSTNDFALTEDNMTNSERYIANDWRYERIESCGHWIPLDQPEMVSELIVDYLSSKPGVE